MTLTDVSDTREFSKISFGTSQGDTAPIAEIFITRAKNDTEAHLIRESVLPPVKSTEKFTISSFLHDPLKGVDLYPLNMLTELPNGMRGQISAVCSDGCTFQGSNKYVKPLESTKDLLRIGYSIFGKYAAEIKSKELAPNHIDSFTSTIFINNGIEDVAVATLSADIIPISRSQRMINGDNRITGLDLISNARKGIYKFASEIGMKDIQYVIELNSLVLLDPNTLQVGANRHLGADYTLGMSRMIMNWAKSRLSAKDLERTCVVAIMNETTGDRFRRIYKVPYNSKKILDTSDIELNTQFKDYFLETGQYWYGKEASGTKPVVALFGNSYGLYVYDLLVREQEAESKLVEA